jgi:tetratricopeptide (TPR) repeat protein
MSSDRQGLRRFQDADDAKTRAQVWVEASRLAAGTGELTEARHLVRAALEIDPSCTDGWLRLAELAEDQQERRRLLDWVLALEPGNVQAQAELARLEPGIAQGQVAPVHPQPPGDQPGAVPRTGRVWHWVLSLSVLVALLLAGTFLVWGSMDSSLAGLLPTPTAVVTPIPTLALEQVMAQFVSQLEDALSDEDWARALEIVSIMNSLDPASEEVRQWSLLSHMQYGQWLVDAGQMAEALVQFDRAVALAPGDPEVDLWQRTTQMYLAGQEALATGDWPAAVEILVPAYQQMSDYGDLADLVVEAYRGWGLAAIGDEDWTVAIEALVEAHQRSPGTQELVDLLATAYRQRGIAWQKQDKLQKARTDLEAALALRPGDAKAQAHYDEVMYILFPPKRIEINISRQRFYAWQGDILIYSFPTSTGLPGRDTAAGHYKVLDKIPMAYSSVWNLKMPYWLGIYYVGNIENGIHALPIRPDGSVMWGGLLGQRASYGCIILSTEAARLIYNWAEIGTAVDIHY